MNGQEQTGTGKGKQSSILFIVLYFGKLPCYFPAWLESVRKNDSIDFLFITDASPCADIPENIHYLQWTWEKLINYIQNKFSFAIHIQTPYKLCDYRPAYGYIFEEYIKDYDFWGNCDVDMVFGDVRKFLTEDILKNNMVIGKYGHLILYKNTDEINRMFMRKGALFPYTEVYSSAEWYSFGEHTGIMQIVLKNHIPHYYSQEYIADIKTAYTSFRIASRKNYKKQFFFWSEGHVYRAFLENDKVGLDEFLYIHFQKKRPRLDWGSSEPVSGFYMTSDVFWRRSCGSPTREEIERVQTYPGRFRLCLEMAVKIIKKMRSFFTMNKRQRKVWLKQRIYRKSRDYISE